MNRTKPLDSHDKKNRFLYLRWITTSEIGHSGREEDNREFSVVERFELKPSSTIRGVVHVVKSGYSGKSFL